MKVSKEIAKKVERYQNLQSEADKLYEEIAGYFRKECDAEGFGTPFIADAPTGEEQCDGEYCDQGTLGEDWYRGTYYHAIEGSDKYVGYSYEIY